MKNFKVTIPIIQKNVDDVIVTALEGGSNYWYMIDTPQATTPENFKRDPEVHYDFLDKVYQGGSIPVYDAEDNESKLGDLTNESIQKGLDLMGKDYPNELSNMLTEDYDANDADIFFQLCVMGEITFG